MAKLANFSNHGAGYMGFCLLGCGGDSEYSGDGFVEISKISVT